MSDSQQPQVTLRRLTLDDEVQARTAHAEVVASNGPNETYVFLQGFDPSSAWADYIDALKAAETAPASKGMVPATLLVAEVDGVMVGRIAVRHRLTDALRVLGGHIGYVVCPSHRGKGYGTEILRQGVAFAGTDLGLDKVLITHYDYNRRSGHVIEKCGGEFSHFSQTDDGREVAHYWIKTSSDKDLTE